MQKNEGAAAVRSSGGNVGVMANGGPGTKLLTEARSVPGQLYLISPSLLIGKLQA